jgi:nuclear pore complex protein Nup93
MGDYPTVLQYLWELPFIPTDRYRLQSCVKAIKIAHPAVTERLQSILLAAGEALMRMNKSEQLSTIVSLAAAVPELISQHAYQRLNELQAQLA